MKSPNHETRSFQPLHRKGVIREGIRAVNVSFSPRVELTARQIRLANYIADYRAKHGKAPCMKLMQAAIWNKCRSAVRLDISKCRAAGILIGERIRDLRPSETFQRCNDAQGDFS